MIQSITSRALSLVQGPQSTPTKPVPTQQAPVQLAPQDSFQLQAPKGQLPISIGLFSQTAIDHALQDLNAAPTEAQFRQAQANFRVAIRGLTDGDLALTEKSLAQFMGSTADYRTQIFLDKLGSDIQFEKLDRQLKDAGLQGQPLESKDPQAMVKAVLSQLKSSPTEANFRQSLANFRVSIRSLEPADLNATMSALKQAMGNTSDYRTQVFLGKAWSEAQVELAWKDKSYKIPMPQMPPTLEGKTGGDIANSALKLLSSSPTEAHFKTSRAAFRVALRSLDATGLNQAEAQVKTVMGQTQDYRTQVFLDHMLTDIAMARFSLN